MSDLDVKMNILIEEANANYNASRYKDAARTFEHLISLAIQNDEPEEAIYFAYRTADCWKKEKGEMNRSLIFFQIGNLAHSFGAEIADRLATKSKQNEDKGKALLLAGQCLLSQDTNKAKDRLNKSANIFKELADNEQNPKKVVLQLRNALEAIIHLQNKKEEKDLKTRIATIHLKIAEEEAAKKSPENLQTALRAFEDSLELFKELKSKENIQYVSKKIEGLKKKVADYDPFAT